jgi:RND family efflux transporter MFP subunit
MRLLKREKPAAGGETEAARTAPAPPTAAAPGAAPPPAAGQRRILYYRSPMDPQVTSRVPTKDAMGMDFVPVYADEAAAQSSRDLPGHAVVTLDAESRRLAGVQTAVAVEEPLVRRVRTVGLVTPDESRLHHVHVKVGGFVEKLYINVTGQRVHSGDPAFSLYSPELLASQEEFLRARRAVEDLGTSALPEVRQAAQELLAASRRRLELVDVPDDFIRDLERSGVPQRTVTLHAQVSGYVTAKNVVEGQQVEPGTELFTITDLSRVWIEADFYESEARLVRVGQRAALDLPYEPGRALDGRVEYVYPYLDPVTRTLKVRFAFANPDLLLKPSMYVDVWLDVEAPLGIVVPESAVLDTGTRQIVFVETAAERFEPRPVQVGLRSNGKVQLVTGVGAGERVVTRANFLLDSESRLRGAFSAAGDSTPGGKP